MSRGRAQPDRAREVFLAALDVDPDQRDAFLEQHCQADQDLRAEVRSMLDRHGSQNPVDHRPIANSDDQPNTQPLISSGPLPMPQSTPPPDNEHVTPARPRSSHPSSRIDHGRYAPGDLIADRYRIVSLLGRGGMGEVYRADDLTLGQTVALKFLPQDLAKDQKFLDTFLNEVRTARQIAHENVCRVYDIAQHNQDHFISMEYVDGETLYSLMRRIGRFPKEKALEIAHELCAGLAAIHDQSILHRDLKPANVMIDGRGRVRVTDFGLASANVHIRGASAAAGTPGYVAPEAINGQQATTASDIYALGLILYELFTGKPAYTGKDANQIIREQREHDPPTPGAVSPDLDTQIQRAITKCLDRHPESRPPSARAVSAMLPGGDPLAAAIAAGRTPSPELVAAAGHAGVFGISRLVILSATVLLSLVLVVLWSPLLSLIEMSPLHKPPEVLVDHAESDILSNLGYQDPGLLAAMGYQIRARDPVIYSAHGFDVYEELLAEITRQDQSPDRWLRVTNRSRPSPVDFWYRASPVPWTALGTDDRITVGMVTMEDPPINTPGMISMRLSPTGQLRELVVTPQPGIERIAEPSTRPEPDTHRLRKLQDNAYAALLQAAELELGNARGQFRPVPPKLVPPVFADHRAAWEGEYDDGVDVHVEAATLNGMPVYFRTIEKEWPQASIAGTQSEDINWAKLLEAVVHVPILLGGLVLARVNLRLKRGDRHGAFCIASFVFACRMIAWALLADIRISDAVIPQFVYALALATLDAAITWLLYIAIEPSVRRWWPETLISWTRLIAGRWKDPAVGEGVLVGTVLGMLGVLAVYLSQLSFGVFGHPPPAPFYNNFAGAVALSGPRAGLGLFAATLVQALSFGIIFLLALVLLRMIVKHKLTAAAIYTVLQASMWSVLLGPTVPSVWIIFTALATGCAYVVIRHGFLSLAVGSLVFSVLTSYPIKFWDNAGSTFYADASAFTILIVLALAVYGVVLSASGVRNRTAPGVSWSQLVSRAAG